MPQLFPLVLFRVISSFFKRQMSKKVIQISSSESMLTAGLSELELRIIIIVCVVVGVLLIIVFLCYLYHRRNNKGNKGEMIHLQCFCLSFVILEANDWSKIVKSPWQNICVGFVKQNFGTWILGRLDPDWGLDWARPYRSWVVQCPPPLLPEGWRPRCQTEGQCRPQPDPWGARQFPVNKHPSFSRQWVIGGKKICRHNTCWRELEKRGSRCDEAFVKTRLKYRNSFRGSATFSSPLMMMLPSFFKRSRINPFQAPPPISSFRCQSEGLESLRT